MDPHVFGPQVVFLRVMAARVCEGECMAGRRVGRGAPSQGHETATHISHKSPGQRENMCMQPGLVCVCALVFITNWGPYVAYSPCGDREVW